MPENSWEKFVREFLVKAIHDVELKLISIEAKLSSVENRLSDLQADMRKILERPEKRRWLM